MRQFVFSALAVVGFVVLSATTQVCRAEAVSYFRQYSGVTADQSQPLPVEFDSKDGYVWRQPLRPGNSTPCVYGDSIFVTTYDAEHKELATVALDRKTGQIRWKRTVPAEQIEPHHPVGSPASCTPACNGTQVFSFFGSYGLLCYDLEGRLLWSKRMGPFQDEFGASSSPVLADGKVILNEDHDVDSFLVAVDQKTGDTVWKTPRQGFTRSYSTPVVWDDGNRKQVVVAGSLQLAGYDVATGKKLWWMNGLSRIVDTTPVKLGNRLVIASWTPGGDQTNRISMAPFADALKTYDRDGDNQIAKTELDEGPVLQRFFRIDLNQDQKLNETEWKKHSRVFERAQNQALAVRPGGTGDITQTHVDWSFRRGLPTVPSPVVYRDVVYMIKDGGIVTLLDANDGQLITQLRSPGRGNYYASAVAGDGKVYLASERGTLVVLKAGRNGEVLSSHDFGERIMATPVIAGGQFYVRTDDALYRFEAGVR